MYDLGMVKTISLTKPPKMVEKLAEQYKALGDIT